MGLNFGLYITNSVSGGIAPFNLFFEQLICDSIVSDACRIDTVFRAYFSKSWFSSAQVYGMHILDNGCREITLQDCVVMGNMTSGINVVSSATKPSTNVKIMACAIENNGSAGIAIQQYTTDCTIVGNSFGWPETTGVFIGTNCDWYIITNNNFHGISTPIDNNSTGAAHQALANNLS